MKIIIAVALCFMAIGQPCWSLIDLPPMANIANINNMEDLSGMASTASQSAMKLVQDALRSNGSLNTLVNQTVEQVVDTYRKWSGDLLGQFGLKSVMPTNGVASSDNSSSFDCSDKGEGYFADIGQECKVFHLCYAAPKLQDGKQHGPRATHDSITFNCQDDTIFDQTVLACRSKPSINCTESEKFFASSNSKLNTFRSGGFDLSNLNVPSRNEIAGLVDSVNKTMSRFLASLLG
ncbi:hypothetical protein HDE_04655 [Halotydeus destructor]|nr:hypothetical protein HDE_04655 [Halotydeus destructor]